MKHLRIYNLIVGIIYFIFVVNDLYSKSNNFCMFNVCFSFGVHRDEEAGKGVLKHMTFFKRMVGGGEGGGLVALTKTEDEAFHFSGL